MTTRTKQTTRPAGNAFFIAEVFIDRSIYRWSYRRHAVDESEQNSLIYCTDRSMITPGFSLPCLFQRTERSCLRGKMTGRRCLRPGSTPLKKSGETPNSRDVGPLDFSARHASGRERFEIFLANLAADRCRFQLVAGAQLSGIRHRINAFPGRGTVRASQYQLMRRAGQGRCGLCEGRQ